jgi:hypothetical protein
MEGNERLSAAGENFCPNFCPSEPTGAERAGTGAAQQSGAERRERLAQTSKTGAVV